MSTPWPICDEIIRIDEVPAPVAVDVRKILQDWLDAAEHRFVLIEWAFPEIDQERRRRLLDRMVATAQKEDIERQARFSMLPEGMAENMLRELVGEILRMEREDVSKLQDRAAEILRRGHRMQKTRWHGKR